MTRVETALASNLAGFEATTAERSEPKAATEVQIVVSHE